MNRQRVRTQYENDPNTLWMGEGDSTAAVGTGMGDLHRLTKDRLWIESGMFGSKSENVPLWAVKDVDVRQSMFQSGGEIGDVVLILRTQVGPTTTLEYSTPGTSLVRRFWRGIWAGRHRQHRGPHKLRDLLMPLISDARRR